MIVGRISSLKRIERMEEKFEKKKQKLERTKRIARGSEGSKTAKMFPFPWTGKKVCRMGIVEGRYHELSLSHSSFSHEPCDRKDCKNRTRRTPCLICKRRQCAPCAKISEVSNDQIPKCTNPKCNYTQKMILLCSLCIEEMKENFCIGCHEDTSPLSSSSTLPPLKEKEFYCCFCKEEFLWKLHDYIRPRYPPSTLVCVEHQFWGITEEDMIVLKKLAGLDPYDL
jgi:hypothetical protein